MPALNRVEIEGHLGKDPELTYTANGTAICKFSVGISEGKGQAAKTEWLNVVIWKEMGELAAKELQKGDAVHIEGKLQTRMWEDKNRVKHYSTEVHTWSYWGRKKGTGPQKKTEPKKQDPVEQMKVPEVIDDQSLPF